MTRRKAAVCSWFLLLVVAGCRKGPGRGGAASRNLPRGDGIWLSDPAACAEAGLEEQLQRIGAAALFLPFGEVRFEGGRWILRADSPPPRPIARVPVVLVLRPGPELSSALRTPAGLDADGIARAIGPAISQADTAGGRFGRVAGLHLDFPFAAAASASYAKLLALLRRAVSPETFVSISLSALPPSEDERKQVDRLLPSADALVAPVFGAGPRVDPGGVDALRRPWWAAYDASAAGTVTRADGSAEDMVPEKYIDRLTGNPRLDFENDLSVNDASVSGFRLVARSRVRVDGVELGEGDRVAFRLPSLAEMLYQLGSSLAGKRFALGRVIVFPAASEADRIFPISAFEDVLLGRTLSPVLEVRLQALGRSSLTIEASNGARHASIVSRLSNWVEVDLAPAHPADVALGGFDRYEVYDGEGRPVSPGRATRVRLFETLFAPLETVSPARIVVRGILPAACCPYRDHFVSAAGPEADSGWSAPPPTPTAVPKRPPSRTKK